VILTYEEARRRAYQLEQMSQGVYVAEQLLTSWRATQSPIVDSTEWNDNPGMLKILRSNS